MATEKEMNKPHTKSFKSIQDDTVTDSKYPNPTVGSGSGAKLPEGLKPNPMPNSTK